MNQSNLDYLQHYGVLGMKWGVRKRRPKQVTNKRQARKAMKKADRYMRKYGVPKEVKKSIKQLSSDIANTAEYKKVTKTPDTMETHNEYIKAHKALRNKGKQIYEKQYQDKLRQLLLLMLVMKILNVEESI